jgi:hypothetical protein
MTQVKDIEKDDACIRKRAYTSKLVLLNVLNSLAKVLL